ncbi:hypothetical protein GCM10020221_21640 [Streptomyces thioluteus]|uniref:Uncharacterized protein n=1 Tax=Streptomyces thioluteus TaxID=66431 RepID=A0ABN3WR87_STRTU
MDQVPVSPLGITYATPARGAVIHDRRARQAALPITVHHGDGGTEETILVFGPSCECDLFRKSMECPADELRSYPEARQPYAAAQQVDAFPAGKKRADDMAFMLGRVLKEMGIRPGDRDSWPRLTGRASLSGEPYVYLGTVPMATARKLVDALVYAESVKRSAPEQRACGAPFPEPRTRT